MPEGISIFDLIIALPLIWAGFKGFKKGLVVEVFSLLALILGVFCAIYFPEFAGDLIQTNFQIKADLIPILAFVVTFIVVVILVNLTGNIIEKMIDVLALGFFNKLGGLAFGIIKSALVLSILLFLFEGLNKKWNLIDEDSKENSILYGPLTQFSTTVIPYFTDAEWVDSFTDEVKEKAKEKAWEEI